MIPFARAWKIFVLNMAWTGAVGAEEAKLDRAKALEELKAIEQKNEKLTQDLLVKSARDFNEAGADKLKACRCIWRVIGMWNLAGPRRGIRSSSSGKWTIKTRSLRWISPRRFSFMFNIWP